MACRWLEHHRSSVYILLHAQCALYSDLEKVLPEVLTQRFLLCCMIHKLKGS